MADALQADGVLGGKAVALHVACHIQAGDHVAVGVEGVAVLVALEASDADQQQSSGELVGVEGAVLQRPHAGCGLVEVLVVAVLGQLVVALDGLQSGLLGSGVIRVDLCYQLFQRVGLDSPAIGHGGLKEGQVLNKLIETYEKQHKKEITDEQVLEAASGEKVLPVGKSKGGIVVRGIHDVAVRFSKCCNPIPGDEIVGFVTRGRGVTIHRTDCVNVLNLPESERARLIDAEWQAEDNGGSLYTVEISVYANNRTGLLVDISKIFTERKIDLAAMNVRTSKQGTASIDVTFDVHNNEELNSIIEKVRQVESVIDIQRSRG